LSHCITNIASNRANIETHENSLSNKSKDLTGDIVLVQNLGSWEEALYPNFIVVKSSKTVGKDVVLALVEVKPLRTNSYQENGSKMIRHYLQYHRYHYQSL
jgi:hypothetical protein